MSPTTAAVPGAGTDSPSSSSRISNGASRTAARSSRASRSTCCHTARRHRLSEDPLNVLYMKVMFARDAVTSELAPALDVQAVHERFFSELVIEGFQTTS